MKRCISFLLTFLLLFSLVACGKKEDENTKKIKGLLTEKAWYRDMHLASDDKLREIYEFSDDYTYIYHDMYEPSWNNAGFSYRLRTGTYTITEDFIILHEQNIKEIDTNDYTTVLEEESSNDEDKIPYTINQYTKELIFDCDRDGKTGFRPITMISHSIHSFPRSFSVTTPK